MFSKGNLEVKGFVRTGDSDPEILAHIDREILALLGSGDINCVLGVKKLDNRQAVCDSQDHLLKKSRGKKTEPCYLLKYDRDGLNCFS